MAASLGEGNFSIQIGWTLFKNWPWITSYSCGGVGKYKNILIWQPC